MRRVLNWLLRYSDQAILVATTNFLLMTLFSIRSDQGMAVIIVVNALFLKQGLSDTRTACLLIRGCQALLLLYGVYLNWYADKLTLPDSVLYVLLIAAVFVFAVNSVLVGIIEGETDRAGM